MIIESFEISILHDSYSKLKIFRNNFLLKLSYIII